MHRHGARRLHYDLRLEINGVLVSWAVPRGPTLDPDVKRIAVRVEDHPIEYLDFEGVIPPGEYGAGDVIVWDRGTWDPYGTDDPAAAVEAGELHADVHGQKLRGRLILVRRDNNRPGSGRSEQWLLMHKHDAHAVQGWDPEDYPRSVLSGRTNDEVKADPERMWRSDLPPSEAAVPVRRPGSERMERLAAGPPGSELAGWMEPIGGCPASQSLITMTRDASRPMSNRNWPVHASSCSSAGVSRSARTVVSPARCSSAAT